MKAPYRVLAVIGVGASLAPVSGCSIDAVLWGPEGAQVISTTERLIDLASTGEADSLACEDFGPGFGDPAVWDGLGAGEPEHFDSDTSADRRGLDAVWRINLEGLGYAGDAGDLVPTDVFYREAADDLCVADIIWQAVDW